MDEVQMEKDKKTVKKTQVGRPKHNILACQDICDIIKSCAEHGIATFKGYDIEFTFLAREETQPAPVNNTGPFVVPTENLDPPTADPMTKEDLVDAEIKMKEEELATLAITDPEQFEDLLARGDLEDGDNEHGTD